jgi:hypothetical protein
MNKYPKKYSNKKSENNPQFNLSEHKKKATEERDEESLAIIKRLENEIEKLLIIKKVREDQRLLNIYKNDINNAMQEGSYNLIEKILLREIELLETGDFEAIAMLNNLKQKAEEKIKKLSEIALQMHQNQIKFNQDPPLPPQQIFVSKPAESYKTYTQYEGFHLEKTMGGEFIQTLDADIKNLVGSDIVNSKPEQLSQNIIAEIKNIRQGNLDIAPENNNSSTNANNVNNLNNNSSIIKKSIKDSSANDINNYSSKSSINLVNHSIKGEWTELVNAQEKQKSQEVGIETGGQSHKK